MPQQFLHGTDVVSVFQQMGGEAMAQGMAGGRFSEAGFAGGGFNAFLQVAFGIVVALAGAAARVG